MEPAQFANILIDIFGTWGWQTRFSEGTGLSLSTVRRYSAGKLPIPQYIVVMVEMMQTLRNNGLPLPDTFSEVREKRHD